MLQANTKEGRMITPAQLSNEWLKHLKESKQAFYCPVCKEKVILRAGPKVVAHFAHTAKTNCLSAKGEGAYHEQGKLMLYKWLRYQNLEVELEKFLPQINQRADLFVHLKGRKIAIEFQCVPIPSHQIIERTMGYKYLGIQVIWILGEKLMKRLKNNALKLNSFTKSMIHQFAVEYPSSLFYFCPIQATIIKYQDFSFLTHLRTNGKLSVYHLNKINLMQLLSRNYMANQSLIKVWEREKHRFRFQPKKRAFGQELAWQQWLYLNRLYRYNLPSYIYVPVAGDYMMKTASWNWQSRIVMDYLNPLSIGQIVKVNHCVHLLRNQQEPSSYFPLIEKIPQPILEYFKLLEKVGILKQVSSNRFRKIKSIRLHSDYETAIKEDQQLLKEILS